MTNESPSPNGYNGKPPFDLEERTAVFGEKFNLRRPGTSIAANYCEADDAASKKDFKNKICTCRKESRETKLWLRMIVAAEPELKVEARKLWHEARELHLIFAAIWRKS